MKKTDIAKAAAQAAAPALKDKAPKRLIAYPEDTVARILTWLQNDVPHKSNPGAVIEMLNRDAVVVTPNEGEKAK